MFPTRWDPCALKHKDPTLSDKGGKSLGFCWIWDILLGNPLQSTRCTFVMRGSFWTSDDANSCKISIASQLALRLSDQNDPTMANPGLHFFQEKKPPVRQLRQTEKNLDVKVKTLKMDAKRLSQGETKLGIHWERLNPAKNASIQRK